MTSPNLFDLFELPTSPLVDGQKLNERFNDLTAQWHPDKFQSLPPAEKEAVDKRFMELNTAYQTLADPKQRLLYLYERTTGSKPPDVQRIPPGTMDLFMEIGQLCRDADTFLDKYQTTTGALARVSLAGEALAWQDKLQDIKAKVETWGTQLEATLGELAAGWSPDNVSKAQLNLIEMTYRKFSYLARWKQQLEERELALFNVL